MQSSPVKLQQCIAAYRYGNLEEAKKLCEELVSAEPHSFDALHLLGVILGQTQQPERAVEILKKAVTINPSIDAAHNNLGNGLRALMRYEEAIAAYDVAITLKPDVASTHNNRGNALLALRRFDEALASYEGAIRCKTDYAEAHVNRGIVLQELKRYDEALASYERAITLKPDHEFLFGTYLFTKMRLCDWESLSEDLQAYRSGIRASKGVTLPFAALGLLDSPEDHKIVSKIYAEAKYPKSEDLGQISKRVADGKIRLGYFSSDFRNHPVGSSIAELIERHDRSHFEITGFSFSKANDGTRQRLAKAFDRFIDVQGQSDKEAVLLARKLGIDIAVNLNGFTANDRTNIFALRAAPIQVNYMGYPGTMGANYIDYLVADPILIPADDRQHYAEKIIYLPDMYHPNDTTRSISDAVFTRAQLGLPPHGFVFCCFNNSYKITPEMFDDWMWILGQVPGSVLWLADPGVLAKANLRREAEQRGIASDRLVFAGRMAALPDHLARLRLADLFLDTLPYNAHVTATDALWAGLPVLTRIGDAFAGRVAASFLNAIGLPELIVPSSQDYRKRAVELAMHRDNLGALKHKLTANRLTTPLFDIERYTRHLEVAYTAIYDRYDAGLPPDHIQVNEAQSKPTR